MRGEFIRRYKPLPAIEDLNPGIEPGWDYGVLILQAEPEERTASGIILSDQTKDDEQLASVEARIVKISAMAFKTPDWPADLPRPYNEGDIVLTMKFPAGLRYIGADGRTYMLVRDKAIEGKIVKAEAVSVEKAA